MMTKYFSYVESLANNSETSGTEQTESLINLTIVNYKRMKRWDKTGKLLLEIQEAISNISSPQKWLFITEAWCADSAHAAMFIQKMADLNTNITLEWKLRDENPELMSRYLTNGARSIPKLIAFDQTDEELFQWGARPVKIQNEFQSLRDNGMPLNEAKIELQKLYNADKGVSMQLEIIDLLKNTALPKSA